MGQLRLSHLSAPQLLGAEDLAKLHFKEFPYHRNLFDLDKRDVEGPKFEGWAEKADYFVRVNIILQVDSTQVSPQENSAAPNITFLSVNQAIVNIFKTFKLRGISFEKFNAKWSQIEHGLELAAHELLYRLNNARHSSGLQGEWFINYGLNERHVEVSKSS